jgi:hypothetical protein
MTPEQALSNLDKAWRVGRFTDAENQMLRESVAVLAQALKLNMEEKKDSGQIND